MKRDGSADGDLLLAGPAFFLSKPPDLIGVAVSGGGDSMALLHVLSDWAQKGGPDLAAVTVNHGLRPEAAEEAAGVARTCAALGVAHDVLHWHWDGVGNLQDQARRARLRLIGDWARAGGIGTVALGHTADDQAETFLMRLARGSGVDGLSGMAPRRQALGVEWVRPLLDYTRSDLRGFLVRRGAAWFDDPTNEDDAYDRVKARKVLAALAPLGIDTKKLTDTAFRLSTARKTLETEAQRVARVACRIDAGDVVIARADFLTQSYETQLRILAHAVRWIASAEYRPRLDALMETHADMILRKTRTLGGCHWSSDKHEIRVTRELKAVRDTACHAGDLWDNRWRLSGPDSGGLDIRALGEVGLADCPDWRAAGRPRTSVLAEPSVWQGDTLIAAPLAGRANGWVANLSCDAADFFTSLLSH